MTTAARAEQRTEVVLGTGQVSAVCYSAELINGVGKEPHSEAHVSRWGIPGDRHYGEMRMSSSQKKLVPNLRTITVCGAEATDAACEALGIAPVPPGGLGENFQVRGLGDLSDVQAGDELHFVSSDGSVGVKLHVEDQNPPCASLKVYHKRILKQLMGRRGLLCTVLQEGTVQPGDTVRWVRAQGA